MLVHLCHYSVYGASFEGEIVSFRCAVHSYSSRSKIFIAGSGLTVDPVKTEFVPCDSTSVDIIPGMIKEVKYTGSFCMSFKTTASGEVRYMKFSPHVCETVIKIPNLFLAHYIPLLFSLRMQSAPSAKDMVIMLGITRKSDNTPSAADVEGQYDEPPAKLSRGARRSDRGSRVEDSRRVDRGGRSDRTDGDDDYSDDGDGGDIRRRREGKLRRVDIGGQIDTTDVGDSGDGNSGDGDSGDGVNVRRRREGKHRRVDRGGRTDTTDVSDSGDGVNVRRRRVGKRRRVDRGGRIDATDGGNVGDSGDGVNVRRRRVGKRRRVDGGGYDNGDGFDGGYDGDGLGTPRRRKKTIRYEITDDAEGDIPQSRRKLLHSIVEFSEHSKQIPEYFRRDSILFKQLGKIVLAERKFFLRSQVSATEPDYSHDGYATYELKLPEIQI